MFLWQPHDGAKRKTTEHEPSSSIHESQLFPSQSVEQQYGNVSFVAKVEHLHFLVTRAFLSDPSIFNQFPSSARACITVYFESSCRLSQTIN